jgi:hypothetical protein
MPEYLIMEDPSGAAGFDAGSFVRAFIKLDQHEIKVYNNDQKTLNFRIWTDRVSYHPVPEKK